MAQESMQKQMAKGNPQMPQGLATMMKKQGYHFVGKHSATKICQYTASSLKGEGTCYKHRFYGIRSWRCIQATPAIGCNLACTFCWRIIPEEEGFSWNELNAIKEWDDPETIVEGLIREHRKIISGYKGNEKVNPKLWAQADDPAHVALSLTGEPLFYPKINGLIEAFHKRKISTFLVTNGTMYKALEKITVLPTQLYVSVQAPNKEVYDKTTRPKTGEAWESFMKFLAIFQNLKTRRVFRLTLVKGVSMIDAKGYADLIRRGKPHYVEVKGFVYVGGARKEDRNLSHTQMPSRQEIMAFAEEIAIESGYIVADYHESSNIALLCMDEDAAKNRIIRFEK